MRSRRLARRRRAPHCGTEDPLLTSPRVSGNCTSGTLGQCLCCRPTFHRPWHPPKGRRRPMPTTRARNSDCTGRASVASGRPPGSGSLPAAETEAATWPAPARISAPGRGSDPRRVSPAPNHDGLPPGRAAHLGRHGPTKAAELAQATGVSRAGPLLRADHYGWFERAPETPPGIYCLTPRGHAALSEHASDLAGLTTRGRPDQP